MKNMKAWPYALKMKTILTFAVGAGCLLVGAAWYAYTKDGILLAISGLLFLFSCLRALALYRAITHGRFEVVEGTCKAIKLAPFRKVFTVKIVDSAGAETSLRLGKQARVKIGRRYRFYFSQAQNAPLGIAWLDTALSSGQYLGCEELEESDEDRSGEMPEGEPPTI